jgi:hypothetical protein
MSSSRWTAGSSTRVTTVASKSCSIVNMGEEWPRRRRSSRGSASLSAPVKREQRGRGEAVVGCPGQSMYYGKPDDPGEPSPTRQPVPENGEGVDTGDDFVIPDDVESARRGVFGQAGLNTLWRGQPLEGQRQARGFGLSPVTCDLAGADRAGVVVDNGQSFCHTNRSRRRLTDGQHIAGSLLFGAIGSGKMRA